MTANKTDGSTMGRRENLMNKRNCGWAAFLVTTATVGATACGSSSNGGGTYGTGGPYSDAGTTTATTTDGGTDGTSTSGSAAPGCSDYCTTIMANCTAANQQYTNAQNCANSCKAFPAGSAADTSGNTLGCRSYHARAAKGDATTHCPHAGPSGDGVCGDVCDGYCQIALMYCTAQNSAQIYTDAADCMADCKAHKTDQRFNVNVQEGNEQACLVYHAQEASSAPADHCTGDLAKTSPSCKAASGNPDGG